MNSRHRGLTTGATSVALAMTLAIGAQAQTAVPNAETHRFIPARQPLDAETATPAAAASTIF